MVNDDDRTKQDSTGVKVGGKEELGNHLRSYQYFIYDRIKMTLISKLEDPGGYSQSPGHRKTPEVKLLTTRFLETTQDSQVTVDCGRR